MQKDKKKFNFWKFIDRHFASDDELYIDKLYKQHEIEKAKRNDKELKMEKRSEKRWDTLNKMGYLRVFKKYPIRYIIAILCICLSYLGIFYTWDISRLRNKLDDGLPFFILKQMYNSYL